MHKSFHRKTDEFPALPICATQNDHWLDPSVISKEPVLCAVYLQAVGQGGCASLYAKLGAGVGNRAQLTGP